MTPDLEPFDRVKLLLLNMVKTESLPLHVAGNAVQLLQKLLAYRSQAVFCSCDL